MSQFTIAGAKRGRMTVANHRGVLPAGTTEILIRLDKLDIPENAEEVLFLNMRVIPRTTLPGSAARARPNSIDDDLSKPVTPKTGPAHSLPPTSENSSTDE